MQSLRIKGKYFLAALGILFYKITLDSSYYYIIGPYFEYAGFENSLSITKLVISYVIILILIPYLITLYKTIKHPIYSYVTLFLILLSFIPNISFLAFNNVSEEYIFFYGLYWFLFLLVSKYMPFFKVKKLRTSISEFPIYVYLTILSGSVLLISFLYTGFRFHFNLEDVYDLRNEARGYNYPSVFNYLLPAAGTILPLLLLFFFEKKNFIITSFIILTILLNFGIAGHKSVLLSLIVTVLFYFFYNHNIIQYVTWILTGIGLIGIMEYVIAGSYIFISLIYRRVLFLPAYLNTKYFEFFSTHSPDFFRQGFLRYFGAESPFKEPIALVIGDTYIGPGCNANNGLFSDSIANLGIIGVFIFPIVLVFIIKIIDSLSRGIQSKILIIPAMMMSISLLSTNFMTSLLTGGIVFTMLLFYIFPRQI